MRRSKETKYKHLQIINEEHNKDCSIKGNLLNLQKELNDIESQLSDIISNPDSENSNEVINEMMYKPTQYPIKALILWIILWICSVYNVSGQSTKAESKKQVNTFEKMTANPNDYGIEERALIYESHISRYLMSNPQKAFSMYRDMIKMGESINDHYMVGRAYNSLGYLHRMRGNLDSNIIYQRKSIKEIAKSNIIDTSPVIALAENYMDNGDLDSAMILSDNALALAMSQDDPIKKVTTLSQKARVLNKQSKYYSALDLLQQALEVQPGGGNIMKTALIYSRISTLYSQLNDINNALIYNEKALDIANSKKYKRMISNLSEIRSAYYIDQRNYKKADSLLTAALPHPLKRNDKLTLLKIYSRLSLSKMHQNESALSKEYLDLAKNYYNEESDDFSKKPYLLSAATYYHGTGNYKEAKKHYKQLAEVGKNLNDIATINEGYRGLKSIAKKQENFEEAFAYADSLITKTRLKDIGNQQNLVYDLENKYQSELKAAEIKQLHSDKEMQELIIEKRSKQLWLSGAGLLFAILAMGGFYQAYQIKQKSNQKLTDTNSKLSKALEDNKMLIKEIHHRVKNNLQVVSSLLNLQSRFEKDDHVLDAINTGKYRVQSMSLLHQNLYNNEDLTKISVKKYFEDLISGIADGYPLQKDNVEFDTKVEDIMLDLDTLVPLGLIANELITNSLKYANVENKKLKLRFRLQKKDDQIIMNVEDNGPGLPFVELPRRSTSMGMQLIHSFVKKLNADIHIDNTQGARVKIVFEAPNENKSSQKLINVAS